jgi:anti-anti-sigma factor
MTAFSTFEIRESRQFGRARLCVSGELDLATVLTFRRRLRALMATNTHVRVDLSHLDFIDSAGAHALDDAIVDSRRGGRHIEVDPNMSHQARRFFDLTKAAGLRADL